MNIDSMSRGGVLDNIDIEVTPSLVDSVYRRALRNRTYFKLHPDERAILYLARRLSRISSPTLKKILLKIFEKIESYIVSRYRVLSIGLSILRRRVEQAVKLGYEKAIEWLDDMDMAIYLGTSYLNTSPIYQKYSCDLN